MIDKQTVGQFDRERETDSLRTQLNTDRQTIDSLRTARQTKR